ncbi:7-cyano-7-deazaguanine synthase [Patescibacteria group bacterium]|nr:7-cyano-7-deazaguanine synthase [Patescibacteria group bacterium]
MKSLRKIMKNRTFEDLSVITSIETIFNNKRGSVFQMPKPGTDVILLVSGGLDSVLTWGLLLEKYRLKVHPLFLNKGEGRASQEERSFNFFSRYYSRRYPSLSKAPVKQTVYLPQKEILTALKTPFDNLSGYDKKITKGFSPITTTNIFLGSPGIVPMFALLHARYLELRTKTKIRTIFSSVMMGDGTVCPSQTITSIRAINLAMCTFTGDYSWQFTSPSIEPALRYFYEKRDMIRWGSMHQIPMEKTWSCYRGLSKQCGACLACISRKYEFKKANVQDNTKYSTTHRLVTRIQNRLKRSLRYFFP